MATLARRLGIPGDPAIPAYEDAWHYLWKERRLPVNVDPLESQLDNPEDRSRLAKVFEQGLGHVVGYALPLKPIGEGTRTRWVSGPWFFRQEHMFLMPGDSPMGFRLPLDSIPWSAPADRQFLEALDPGAPLEPLPKFSELVHRQVATPAPRAAGWFDHHDAPLARNGRRQLGGVGSDDSGPDDSGPDDSGPDDSGPDDMG